MQKPLIILITKPEDTISDFCKSKALNFTQHKLCLIQIIEFACRKYCRKIKKILFPQICRNHYFSSAPYSCKSNAFNFTHHKLFLLNL